MLFKRTTAAARYLWSGIVCRQLCIFSLFSSTRWLYTVWCKLKLLTQQPLHLTEYVFNRLSKACAISQCLKKM